MAMPPVFTVHYVTLHVSEQKFEVKSKASAIRAACYESRQRFLKRHRIQNILGHCFYFDTSQDVIMWIDSSSSKFLIPEIQTSWLCDALTLAVPTPRVAFHCRIFFSITSRIGLNSIYLSLRNDNTCKELKVVFPMVTRGWLWDDRHMGVWKEPGKCWLAPTEMFPKLALPLILARYGGGSRSLSNEICWRYWDDRLSPLDRGPLPDTFDSIPKTTAALMAPRKLVRNRV